MNSESTGTVSATGIVDVAIVGYGPVGETAANLLGGMGLRVLVLEREPSVYERARAISTDEEVIRIWQAVGLSERLKADMLGEKPIDLVDSHGRSFLTLAPAPRGSGHPTQMFIYQPALEQVLREGVDRYPNVDVRLGHECLSVEDSGEHVDLRVAPTDGTAGYTARARYVIAADGGSSPIRRQLGIGFVGKTYEDRWVVIDTKVTREWPEVDRLRFHCDPARPAVDCPTPLGHHRWEFPILPGDDEDEIVTTRSVRRLLSHQGVSAEHVEILRAVIYSHHVRFATRWRSGRVFLAGDSAHVMPPWIGEGMASGVRDVWNLCWKLDAVLSGALPESVLDSYESERQPHVRKVTRVAVYLGRLITERNRAIAAIRNPLARLTMRLPKIGAAVRDARWFPAAYYGRGYFSEQLGTRASRWQIAQPWVLDAAGQRVRLDDAIAAGWTVLHLSARGDAGTFLWSRAGVPVIEVRSAGSEPAHGAIVDVDGELGLWLASRKAKVVALRPDGWVFASSGRGELPPPPFTDSRAANNHVRADAPIGHAKNGWLRDLARRPRNRARPERHGRVATS